MINVVFETSAASSVFRDWTTLLDENSSTRGSYRTRAIQSPPSALDSPLRIDDFVSDETTLINLGIADEDIKTTNLDFFELARSFRKPTHQGSYHENQKLASNTTQTSIRDSLGFLGQSYQKWAADSTMLATVEANSNRRVRFQPWNYSTKQEPECHAGMNSTFPCFPQNNNRNHICAEYLSKAGEMVYLIDSVPTFPNTQGRESRGFNLVSRQESSHRQALRPVRTQISRLITEHTRVAYLWR